MDDIFSMDDLTDIPQHIKDELKVVSRDAFEKNIIALFHRAMRDLSIDEVTVGYYRLYGEAKERKQIMAKLYNMTRSDRPALRSVVGKKGVYRLIIGDNE